MKQRTMPAPAHAKSTNVRQRAFVALVAIVAALSMPAAGAALDDAPPAVSEHNDELPESFGAPSCWLASLVRSVTQRIPDPITRLQIRQRIDQKLPMNACCSARGAGLHLPHYTGRVTVPDACGIGR